MKEIQKLRRNGRWERILQLGDAQTHKSIKKNSKNSRDTDETMDDREALICTRY